MRVLVLSDLHANLEALRSVLEDARPRGWDQVWILGDLVGYGADPEAVVQEVRALQPSVIVRGNHDRAACGAIDTSDFNAAARAAAVWTQAALSPESLEYLRVLPAGPLNAAPGIWVAHGTPEDEDEYLLDEDAALRQFEAYDFGLCFIGHSHLAFVYSLRTSRLERQAPPPAEGLRLWPGERHLFNPGSVGQPRDRDRRAAYAVLDTVQGRVAHYRVEYDIPAAAAKIVAAGLPPLLARRLQLGS